MEEMRAACVVQLDRIRALAPRCGFRPVTLPDSFRGAHLAIVLDESVYVALSLEFGMDVLFVTSGVLRDVTDDRLTALQACNALTRSRPAFPCFLAPADGPYGSDVILQQGHPLSLVHEAPGFFKFSVETMSSVTAKMRERLESEGLGGAPYRWNDEDIHRLTIRAL